MLLADDVTDKANFFEKLARNSKFKFLKGLSILTKSLGAGVVLQGWGRGKT